MNTNVAHWTKKHGVKVLGLMAASAITAALLSACSGSCAGDNSKVVSTTPVATTTVATTDTTATPNDGATAAADNEATSVRAQRSPPRTVATAPADKNVGGVAALTGTTDAPDAYGEANTNPTDMAAAKGAIAATAAQPANSATAGLERGHTRTLVGWSDKGLVVTYAGWFCDMTMALNEGKVDAKTANVTVSGTSDGDGIGCDKPTAVSVTFADVPRTAHVLKLDPGHGKRIETVKFTSGDMVQSGGAITTEETRGRHQQRKHAATH